MRKITVLVESTQSKHVLQSNATTLGELKDELRDKNISFNSDDVFKEGMSKTVLTTDESILPSNIPWRGEVTNDLIFMVTAPQKKIKSGVMTRAEVYAEIKRLKLQDTISKKVGKNFTQCSTAVLLTFIDEASKNSCETKTPAPVAKKKKVKSNPAPEVVESVTFCALKELIAKMVNEGVLSEANANNILGVASGKPALPVEKEESYDELAVQFDF
mgnify:FL=1